MEKDNVVDLKKPASGVDDPLTEVLRQGARAIGTVSAPDFTRSRGGPYPGMARVASGDLRPLSRLPVPW